MALPDHIRAFLEQPHHCVMATINRDGTPQLTTMWYALSATADIVLLNMTRGLVKERNLRRDPRLAICVADGPRYVTLQGRAEIIEDRRVQEEEVRHIATRYIGVRLGAERWNVISRSDRLGLRLHVERWHSHNL
jgi:PPOX class probable F420-dependent enzyme